ncbi:MAG: ABC transporter six-transmembrane domain-containing protein [Ignavibacteriae bacterium]|nr:ABC transporter six-transmembrane domain-containing protein [Ignavibacteriota bacterium]
MTFPEIIKKFKYGILLAFIFVIIENVAWIAEPYVFGKLIDAVIDVHYFGEIGGNDSSDVTPEPFIAEQDYSAGDTIVINQDSLLQESRDKTRITVDLKKYLPLLLFPLFLWVGVFAINTIAGVIRRILDTKIFLKIYADIASHISEISITKKRGLSLTVARAELSQEYIVFFQHRIPEILESLIAIGGTIFALYFFDWIISLTCLIVVLPLYFLNTSLGKRIFRLQKEYHDNYENLYNVFALKDHKEVRRFYTKLSLPQIKISRFAAINFGTTRFLMLIVFLIVLYICIELDQFSAGEIYSIAAYLWTFVTSAEHLPELVESFASLKDISNRMKSED